MEHPSHPPASPGSRALGAGSQEVSDGTEMCGRLGDMGDGAMEFGWRVADAAVG